MSQVLESQELSCGSEWESDWNSDWQSDPEDLDFVPSESESSESEAGTDFELSQISEESQELFLLFFP
jgi:hypothetical protein